MRGKTNRAAIDHTERRIKPLIAFLLERNKEKKGANGGPGNEISEVAGFYQVMSSVQGS
jgi:hypothetical protein